MTLSRLKQHEDRKEKLGHDNVNFTCFGEYCTLIKSLDQHRDVIQSEQDLKHVKSTSSEVESRDRASKVLKRLLLKSELANLEESGKMIHLRISQPICKLAKRDVPKESILMSQREHRLSFLELMQAENAGSRDVEEVCKHSSSTESINTLKKSSSWDIHASNGRLNDTTTQSNVDTCEMCYHVYRLLGLTRCLLRRDYISTSLGQLEDKVFNLNQIVERSGNIPQKKLKKSQQNGPTRRLMNSSKVKKSCTEMRKVVKDVVADEQVVNNKDCINNNHQSSAKTKKQSNATSKRKVAPKERRSVVDCKSRKCHVEKTFKASSSSTLSAAKENTSSVDDTIHTFHYNDQTSFPYTVLGRKSSMDLDNDKKSCHDFYNMVVCHDLFETLERMKIFLSSFSEQYPHNQILLWNYPGQAYTSFSSSQCLNNDFHAKCLSSLLRHVGVEGTNEFDHRKPFFILGHGHGGSVACQHAAKCQYIPGLKGIYLINPLTFVDVHFASVMHDCRNVFSCSPETRPDLPLYFYSRFIFSKEYLNKVSTPLALNLYTAIHNPISVKGRISLCDGVLNNIDLRESLKLIKAPIITLHGKNAELIRPLHAAAFLDNRNQCSTIHGVLGESGKNASVLIMTDGGHELFQEKKKQMLMLLVELLTGYHEKKNVHVGDRSHTNIFQTTGDNTCWSKIVRQTKDMNSPETKAPNSNDAKKLSPKDINNGEYGKDQIIEEEENQQNLSNRKDVKSKIEVILDPANPCFERHQNNVYKAGSGSIYPSSNVNVKPQEYMSWRLKRNRKRLSRFQKAARIIQGSLRVYMAKTMIARLKRQRSALNIQRCYRGMLDRRIFKEKMKELWAARLLQRAYRGAVGRRTSYYRRISIQAQISIARVWRGHVARVYVNEIKLKRDVAAIHFQSLWRRCMAIDYAQHLRTRKQSSTIIQRVFRGHLGRRKAERERDKYVFSKSQSMGIELGRKMLAEHKLKATRLQSELSVLEKERTSIESKVGTISTELGRFQDNAKQLEKSMHEITAVEAQKRYDAATQHAIRQKKVQLDEDFSGLLAKIADRKNQLKILEEKLSLLEKNKRDKKEDLQKLERKLVAILEAQENEINEIKRRQNEKVDKIARTGVFPPSSSAPSSNVDMQTYESHAVAAQKKRETAKLMDSTETMMKFGFMSMAMTYFTSMNMVGAMKNVSMNEMNNIEKANLDNFMSPYLKEGKGVVNSVVPHNKSPQADILKWDVNNVAQWLSAIYLSQYEDSFRDASVDGPFLCQLTDEDLKDALGIEHKLHRKKIIFGINQLRSQIRTSTHVMPSEQQSVPNNTFEQPTYSQPTYSQKTTESTTAIKAAEVTNIDHVLAQAMEETKRSTPTIDQLCRWMRNQKIGRIKESLQHLPATDFDQSDVRVQYADGVGTAYTKAVEEQIFHINKCDDHGNTLMHIAAQNGNVKIAMFLINKGANPNHQNKQGQTPGHFAVSYQFFDFASWLFDPDGGKGNDLLTNIYGLGPYDGLSDG